MKNFLLSSIAQAINTYLRLDPDSSSRLQALAQKSIAIVPLPFTTILYCQFSATGIALSLETTSIANAIIKGTPLQLLEIARDKQNRRQLLTQNIVIEGDVLLCNQVMALFDSVDIDWEELLSQQIGDLPSFYTSHIANRIRSRAIAAATRFCQDINEYIHEETLWFPERSLLQDFFTDIDELRLDVDRLQAKIEHLTVILNSEETL